MVDGWNLVEYIYIYIYIYIYVYMVTTSKYTFFIYV